MLLAVRRKWQMFWFYFSTTNGTPLQYSCLENPMDRGNWWAAVHGIAKSQTRLSDFTFTSHFHFSLSCIGEGNGNPLQCSCLENPMDRGAWWATAHGVAKSRTRLSDFTFTSTLDCFPYFASIDSTALCVFVCV